MTPRRIRLALVLYGALGAAALAWGTLRGRPDLYHHPAPWMTLPFPVGTLVALALGLGVALATVVATRILVRRTRWAESLHLEFRHLLGPLSAGEIVVFALTSGVAEELFFRGAMQPALGLIATSVLFGLIHLGPMRRFWIWSLWAGIMGLVFGSLHALTGELLAPVVAHVIINYENLHFIETYDPRPAPPPEKRDGAREVSPPRLVSTRLRSGAPDS